MWWRFLIWLSFCIPFFWIAFLIRRGKGRTNRWFLHVFAPIAYSPLPWGLTISIPLVLLLLPFNSSAKTSLFCGVTWAGIFLAFVVFPIWKPKFLKPDWLRRLEAQYSPETIQLLRGEWMRMDRDEWANKIGTEEGMQELVALVTDKYGEYDPDR